MLCVTLFLVGDSLDSGGVSKVCKLHIGEEAPRVTLVARCLQSEGHWSVNREFEVHGVQRVCGRVDGGAVSVGKEINPSLVLPTVVIVPHCRCRISLKVVFACWEAFYGLVDELGVADGIASPVAYAISTVCFALYCGRQFRVASRLAVVTQPARACVCTDGGILNKEGSVACQCDICA